MLKPMKFFLVVFFMILLTGCSADVEDLELRSSSGQVNLAQQVPGDWKRICIFTPYTTGGTAEELSGIPGYIVNATDIAYSDSFVILAALYEDESYSLYRVSMASVVFVIHAPECFGRDQAILRTR